MWILPNNLETSSAFVADTLALSEDLSLPGLNLEHSLMWRSKPSPQPTWSRRWKRVPWFRHLSGRILKPSHHISFETRLTSSLLDIHASPFQTPESAPERMIQDISGPTSENISRQCDLFDASSKTSKGTSASDLEKLLKTWKNLVIKRRGEYLARVKSVRRIRESESTSWPTPSATSYGSNQGGAAGRTGKVRHSLESMAKHNLWPTPIASDGPNMIGSKEAAAKENERTKGGVRLSGAVLLEQWPTPTARDYKGASGKGRQERKGNPADTLPNAVKMWPTPAARDYKGANGYQATLDKIASGQRAQMGQLPNAVMIENKGSGHLNPDWVEKLMGVPVGWTSLTGTNNEVIDGWDSASWEAGIPRVSENTENRVDRIRALGNGVVPQTAAKAWTVLDKEITK